MKVLLTLEIEVDLPEDITREDIQQSMAETKNLWLAHVDKTVPATVKAVDFRENYEQS